MTDAIPLDPEDYPDKSIFVIYIIVITLTNTSELYVIDGKNIFNIQ